MGCGSLAARPLATARPLLAGSLVAVLVAAAPVWSGEDGPRPSGGGAGSSEEVREPDAFERLMARLRERYPERDDVARHAGDISLELVDFIERHPNHDRVGEARALAAEVLLLSGSPDDVKAARELWADLVREGPRDADRALGLFLLGEYYFLRRHRGGERFAGFAERFYAQLVRQFPGSRWAEPARRALRFLELAGGAEAPSFRAEFRHAGDVFELGREELEGKIVLLIFWRSATPGHGHFEQRFLERYLEVLQDYPVLDGRVEVLGVNLDPERALLEAAVRRWRIQWPQHHAADGFEDPLVRGFALPRTPAFAVIDPAWQMRYLGHRPEAFFHAALATMREHRLAIEAAADGDGGGDPGDGGDRAPAAGPSGEQDAPAAAEDEEGAPEAGSATGDSGSPEPGGDGGPSGEDGPAGPDGEAGGAPARGPAAPGAAG